MNIQRNIILIALAVVSWLMIQQWNKDYVQTQSQHQNAVVNEETVSASIPTAPSATAPNASDIPSQPTATANSSAAPANAVADSTRMIQVETDVFSIKIDPVGGDIVYIGLKKYPQSKEDTKPFILMNRTKDNTFIAQSGLVGKDGTDAANAPRPTFSASQAEFSLADNADKLEVPLSYTQANGALITKTYVFERNNYKVDLRYDVKNVTDKAWAGSVYTQLKRDSASDPSITNGLSSMPTYLGSAYWTPETPFNKLDFDEFADKPLKLDHKGGWVAVVQHYFVSAWIGNPQDVNHFTTSVLGDIHSLTTVSPQLAVEPGQSGSYQVSLYAGPKIRDELIKLSPGLDLAVDYGILFFIAKVLFWFLTFYHGLIDNWGIAIILLTVTVKALFYWPSKISYTSMAKMRKIGPKMTELKERFGDDRAAMSQAMMKLYQEEKVNPFGGCLPILIQMPVFIALYWVLLESVELRQAPFYGWIKDLSAMDPYFVLPILMTLSMVVQQRLNPAPPDPMQAQMMKWMPLIFGVMFLWFPAGLVLYWVTNNVLSIAQQWTITRAIENEEKKHPYAHHKK